ncbi:MAG: hypothetical protein QW594_03825, partial [Candidatus Woesearchaeota archaeon]
MEQNREQKKHQEKMEKEIIQQSQQKEQPMQIQTIIGTFMSKNGTWVLEQPSGHDHDQLYHWQGQQAVAMLATKNPQQYYALLQALRQHTALLKQALTLHTIFSIKTSFKEDLIIIQAINTIDETTKAINLLMKRCSEWAGYILPELLQKSPLTMIALLAEKRRDELLKELNLFEEESMGMIPNDEDYHALQSLARTILALQHFKEEMLYRLDKAMAQHCPNTQHIAGTTIGARLIALSGSLERMALSPASKIQLLGAEKALFRHLTTGAKSPKHGILHEHPLVQKHKEKGKVAR